MDKGIHHCLSNLDNIQDQIYLFNCKSKILYDIHLTLQSLLSGPLNKVIEALDFYKNLFHICRHDQICQYWAYFMIIGLIQISLVFADRIIWFIELIEKLSIITMLLFSIILFLMNYSKCHIDLITTTIAK